MVSGNIISIRAIHQQVAIQIHRFACKFIERVISIDKSQVLLGWPAPVGAIVRSGLINVCFAWRVTVMSCPRITMDHIFPRHFRFQFS